MVLTDTYLELHWQSSDEPLFRPFCTLLAATWYSQVHGTHNQAADVIVGGLSTGKPTEVKSFNAYRCIFCVLHPVKGKLLEDLSYFDTS